MFGFEVLSGPADIGSLILQIDNPDLLPYAIRMGENVTVRITMATQTIIAQHGVFLSLDCSSILFDLEPGVSPPNITWRRRLLSGIRQLSLAVFTSTLDWTVDWALHGFNMGDKGVCKAHKTSHDTNAVISHYFENALLFFFWRGVKMNLHPHTPTR